MKRTPILTMSEAIQQLWEAYPDMYEKVLETKALKFMETQYSLLQKYIISQDIREGILYLKVNSSTMKHQMLIGKQLMIDRINEAIGVYLLHDIVVY